MVPGIAEKKNNVLPLWGNEKTMNLNNLILTNILSSHYFKVNLYQLKTYHEVIDEIYYQVTHLEPWEKGSRKTSGQTGMCGGVRGVGAGGIVSTAFCILYKLFTLKLTRKQVVGLINHADSAYIRALGFMYIRYTQPPSDLWDWYEFYLSDEEELDVKAGGGQMMSIGEMLRHFLSKLEWFSTLFPRIPVPIQKDLERKLSNWRGHCKSKSLTETSSEQIEDSESLSIKETWNDSASNLRSFQETKLSVEDFKNSKDKVDVSKDITREKDRQKREKERVVSSPSHHNHTARHKSRHRSRSPVAIRDGDEKRSSKKYHDKERDIVSERKYHKSHDGNRYKDFDFEREAEGRYPKDKGSNYDRRKERRHSHLHSHDHSKRHEKHSHSRSREY